MNKFWFVKLTRLLKQIIGHKLSPREHKQQQQPKASLRLTIQRNVDLKCNCIKIYFMHKVDSGWKREWRKKNVKAKKNKFTILYSLKDFSLI